MLIDGFKDVAGERIAFNTRSVESIRPAGKDQTYLMMQSGSAFILGISYEDLMKTWAILDEGYLCAPDFSDTIGLSK